MPTLRPFLAAAEAAAALALFPAPAAAQSPCGASYTVRPGDTLYSIAQRCRTPIEAILRANAFVRDPSRIEAGWRLAIPGGGGGDGAGAPPPQAGERGYRVRPGDTLFAIAARLGLRLADLIGANPGIDPRRIGIGDVIRLPGEAPPPPRDGDGDGDRGEIEARVRPDTAAPGEMVTLQGRGFAAGERVRIGVGPPRAEYQRIGVARADARGWFDAEVRVPDWARPGRELVWVLFTDDRREAFARGFRVAEPGRGGDGDGSREVTGMITREGVECPALRADDGRLYTLAGDTGRFGPGDRVTVRGRIAQMSICMQGTTIEVRAIRAAPWDG